MFLTYSAEKINHQGMKEFAPDLFLFVKGYIIWKHELYQDQNFETLVISHLKAGSLFQNIPYYNGCFNIVILYHAELIVINDRWGIFPLFYYKNQDKIVISDVWKHLIPYSGSKIRKDSTYESLCFGYVLGEKTMIDKVFEFNPHSYYRIWFENQKMKLKTISYWYLEHNFSGKSRSPEEFKELWESRMKIFADFIKRNHSGAYIPLTAGLDSRLLATELDKYDIPLYTMTWGNNYHNFEIQAAGEIASQLGNIRGHYLMYLNDSMFSRLRSFHLHGNRITSLMFGQPFYYYQNLVKDECDTFFPGHSGGFMAGGHLKYRMKSWKNQEDVIRYIFRFKSSPLTNHLIGQNKEIRDILMQSVRETLPSNQDPISTFIRWDLEQLQRRYIIRSSLSEPQELMKLYLPYYDYELMDFFLNLPFKQLLNKNLKIEAITKNIYKDQPYFRAVKNNGKKMTPVRNNFVYEYKYKLISHIKQKMKMSSRNSEEYTRDIDWQGIFESLEFPKFIDKDLLRNKYLKQKLRHYYNLSSFIQELKSY